MATYPQITVKAGAEAVTARAEVRSVPAPQRHADQPIDTRQVKNDVVVDLPATQQPKDYFVEKDGMRFAGIHLIVDMWEAEGLNDKALIERAMVEAVERAGATLLHIHLHEFSENGGVSGVAVLAESHISVHTWPERGYAAFDIFMCGEAKPNEAVIPLKEAFRPGNVLISEHKRGVF